MRGRAEQIRSRAGLSCDRIVALDIPHAADACRRTHLGMRLRDRRTIRCCAACGVNAPAAQRAAPQAFPEIVVIQRRVFHLPPAAPTTHHRACRSKTWSRRITMNRFKRIPYPRGRRQRSVRRFERIGVDDLTPGEVVIDVQYSGINYKDALGGDRRGQDPSSLSTGRRHRSRRRGAQLRRMRASSQAMRCCVTGRGLSETLDGGYARVARVPAEAVIADAAGLDAFSRDGAGHRRLHRCARHPSHGEQWPGARARAHRRHRRHGRRGQHRHRHARRRAATR